MLRIIDHWSMQAAVFGRCSDSWIPGTLVETGWNSPRYSAGASGFMSHMSRWLGPPRIPRMMTDVLGGAEEPVGSAGCGCGSDDPQAAPAPAPAARRNSRRFGRGDCDRLRPVGVV